MVANLLQLQLLMTMMMKMTMMILIFLETMMRSHYYYTAYLAISISSRRQQLKLKNLNRNVLLHIMLKRAKVLQHNYYFYHSLCVSLSLHFIEPALIAKSNIILDVKPWDDETDMRDIEAKVRSIEADGLVWGACKY